jgi:hypothetical protein
MTIGYHNKWWFVNDIVFYQLKKGHLRIDPTTYSSDFPLATQEEIRGLIKIIWASKVIEDRR